MRKQTPMECRVHTGVNGDLGPWFLFLAPSSSCFLPWSTASSTTHKWIYISYLWALFFFGRPSSHRLWCLLGRIAWLSGLSRGWQIMQDGSELERETVRLTQIDSMSSLQEKRSNMVAASSFSRKARFQFLFEISCAGKTKENMHVWGTLASCWPDCSLHLAADFLSLAASIIVAPVA